MRPFLAGLVVAALAFAGSPSARADLPPPDGQKFVDFGFKVKGINASAGRALFAYPCGQSSGAPIAQHQKLQDGGLVTVGRRGGPCTIYAIAQAEYEAFAKDYKPTMAGVDPALDALAKKAQRCEGAAPSLSFTLAKSDPRGMVEETLEVVTLDATTCKLKSLGASGTPPAATGATGASGGAAPPSTAPATPKKDAGCAMTGTGGPARGERSGVVALLAVGLLLMARRPRRRCE